MQTDEPMQVLIVQRRLTHYRVAFFEALRAKLSSRGVALVVAHGEPELAEAGKRDSGVLPWAVKLPTRYLLGGRLCWQPFSRVARFADLVVLTHENKLICNLGAQFGWRRKRVALWGHGANLQGRHASWREIFKRRTSLRADWWFGYTEMSRRLLLENGFPADRISVVDNAIDTEALRQQFQAVGAEAVSAMLERSGFRGGRVGVFVGSLYEEKRIDFLLAAACRIRELVPGFELLIAGAGPDSREVEAFCSGTSWARYLGPVTGREKAVLLSASRVMLNPGLVGLGVLDSFVCRVPMVTTDCGIHSPEIAYLENGHNGRMTADTLGAYVDACVELLTNDTAHAAMVAGCAGSSARYTVERMAENFADGVMACLDAPIHRGS